MHKTYKLRALVYGFCTFVVMLGCVPHLRAQRIPLLSDIAEVKNVDSLEAALDSTNLSAYLQQLLVLENSWSTLNHPKMGSKLALIKKLTDKKTQQKYQPITAYWQAKYEVKNSQLNKALTNFLSAQKGFETRKDTVGLVQVYCNLTNFYFNDISLPSFKQQNLAKGTSYANKAVVLAESFDDKYYLLSALEYLHMSYGYNEVVPEVNQQLLERQLRIIEENNIKGLLKLAVLANSTNYYSSVGKHQKALKIIEDNLIDFRKNFSLKNYQYILINAIQECEYMGLVSKQKEYIKQLLSISTDVEFWQQRQVGLTSLRNLYQKENRFELADAYADSILVIADSINVLQNVKDIAELEAQSKEVKAENELLAKENVLMRSRNIIGLIALAVGILLISILLILLRNNIRRRKESTLQSQEIDRLSGIRDEYIKIIAHDLRAPLFAMQGVYDVLKNIIQQRKFEELETVVNYVEESSNTTRILVDKMLNWGLSQQEEVGYQPEKIVLLDVIKHVVAEYDIVRSVKKCEIILACDPKISIYADPMGFQLILRNLLDNAVKSVAKNKGKVCISAEPETNLNMVRITISDNGKGIAPAKLADINAVFENPLNIQHQKLKLGLGILMISKFTKRNRGTMVASSEQYNGSTFVLTLPKG